MTNYVTRIVRLLSVLVTTLLMSACAITRPPGEPLPPVVEAGVPAGEAGRTSVPTKPPAATVVTTPLDTSPIESHPLPSPTPTVEDYRPQPAPQSAPQAAPGATAGGNNAVLALLDRADQQQATDPNAAAASLERALRIEPDNAMLWYRLGEVRLNQGQPVQAAQLAAKALNLAKDDTALQARCWRLIERTRLVRGDESGARSAAERASALE